MNREFVLLAFASMLLLSAVIGSQLIVSVAAQSVGVSPGDWAEYAGTPSANGTLPSFMNITWSKVTVLEISGTNITFQQIMRYANTTEDMWIGVVDVATGQGNGTGSFIAANLTQGDLIYTDPSPGAFPPGATINETVSREYLGETVEVNHLNITTSMKTPLPENATLTMFLNFYWYRATGMLAEMSMYQLEQPEVDPATWTKLEIVIIPEFPSALILPLFMIATLAAVWLGKTIWSTKKLIKKPSPCA